MTISISDLSPATSDSLVAAINEEEGGVIKSAVARALEARKVMGGANTIAKVDPVIVGRIFPPKPIYPPIIVGLIALPDDRATV